MPFLFVFMVVVVAFQMIAEAISKSWGTIGPIVLSVGVGFVVIALIKRTRRMNELDAQKEAARLAAEKRRVDAEAQTKAERRERQKRYRDELSNLCEQSLRFFELMSVALEQADHFLSQAESDFREGVYSPFWDSIERSAQELGKFDSFVKAIHTNLFRYRETRKSYEGAVPAFPIQMSSVQGMTAAEATSLRMQKVVRSAQRDPHFSMIFEQRRTNQILIAGFTSLAHAINGLGDLLTSSIEQLGGEISAFSDSMKNSMSLNRENTSVAAERIATEVNSLRQGAKSEAVEIRIRHEHALEMLNNIQRRRIVRPKQYDDGKY